MEGWTVDQDQDQDTETPRHRASAMQRARRACMHARPPSISMSATLPSVQKELVARGTTDPKLVRAMLDMYYPPEVLPRTLQVVDAKLQPSQGGASGEFTFVAEQHMCGTLSKTLFGGWLPSLTDSLTASIILGHRVRVAQAAGKSLPMEVSVELNCSITRAAPLGSKVLVKVNVIQAGGKAAFAEARFLDEKGRVLAVGRHVVMVVVSSM